jgi:hypothetical protein
MNRLVSQGNPLIPKSCRHKFIQIFQITALNPTSNLANQNRPLKLISPAKTNGTRNHLPQSDKGLVWRCC